jgi:uncharacterized protein
LTLLLVIGDIHGQFAALERVLGHAPIDRVHAVLLTGDLGLDRTSLLLPSALRVVEIAASAGRPVVFVPGNHDLPDLPVALSGADNADDRRVDVAGLRVRGVGGAGPARFGFPYEWGEDDVRRRPRIEADILLTHTPPIRSLLDLCSSGAHAGSAAVREMLSEPEGKALRLLVCGHIHEAPGVEVLDGKPCYNAGSLGAPFGRVQYGLVEVEEPASVVLTHRMLDDGTERSWRFEDGKLVVLT